MPAIPRFLAAEARARPAPAPPPFDYATAFSRNIGWLTEWEQQALRGKCVAIAGMGGVGGVHLLTLARFGIGGFRIADLDRFELANFNRQVGATLATIGRPKVEVLEAMARQINPELRITSFERGLTETNLNDFLANVDLLIDGLDFFAIDIRRAMMAQCAKRRIPVINAAPLGMGTAFLVFQPGGMSFDEWFRLDGLTHEQQYVSYLFGMAPSMLHRSYLADPRSVDLRGHRGPSTPAACELCAGVVAVEAIKLLIGRGRVRAVPWYHQFDAYSGRFIARRMARGNRDLRQRVKIALGRRLAQALSRSSVSPDQRQAPLTEIENILDIARWTPSGDNVQPWRFRIVSDDMVMIELTDQSDHDLYDYRGGEPTLLAGGMLLESLRIAATAWGREIDWEYGGRDGAVHAITVRLRHAAGLELDPLFSHVPMRSVDRRRYRLVALTDEQKRALAQALGDGIALRWCATALERWRITRIGARATRVRLATPEVFDVHRRVVDWEHPLSTDGIPARAAGIGRPSLGLMRWAMKSWPRMRLLNRIGGAAAAAVQMDYLPGLFSAAFFTLRVPDLPAAGPERVIGLLEAGQRIQRFWLTATRLGLVLQPTMAALIFAHYGDGASSFSNDRGARRKAAALATAARRVLDPGPDLVFMGRIGVSLRPPKAIRSIRRPLEDLMLAR